MTHVIVFTDYGTNPDDLLALYMLSKLQDFRIAGLIATGDLEGKRSSLVMDFLSLLGLSDIPVACGFKRPISATSGFRHFGYEAVSVKHQAQIVEAKDLICMLAREVERPVILSLGPLTDIAIHLGPLLTCNASLVGMGGTISGVEYNFCIDPEATRLVLNSAMSKRIVPLDLTKRFFLKEEAFLKLKLPDDVERLLQYQWKHFQVSTKRDKLYLNDPLAVLLLHRPEFFKFERVRFEFMEENGLCQLQAVPNPASYAELAIDVDKKAFYDSFFSLVNENG